MHVTIVFFLPHYNWMLYSCAQLVKYCICHVALIPTVSLGSHCVFDVGEWWMNSMCRVGAGWVIHSLLRLVYCIGINVGDIWLGPILGLWSSLSCAHLICCPLFSFTFPPPSVVHSIYLFFIFLLLPFADVLGGTRARVRCSLYGSWV